MGRKPRGPATIVDTLTRWRREGEEIEAGLRRRLDQLRAEISIVEQALDNFGERRAARAPKKVRAAVPKEAPAAAPPAGELKGVAAELQQLRPFWGHLKEQTRKIVELRVAGKPPREISKLAGIATQAVSGRIFAALTRMRAARQAGDKPEDEGADDSEEADGKPAHVDRFAAIEAAAKRLKRPAPPSGVRVDRAETQGIIDEMNRRAIPGLVRATREAFESSVKVGVPPPAPAIDPKFVSGVKVVVRVASGPERIATVVGPGNRSDMFRVQFGAAGTGKTQVVVADEILRVAAAD